MLDSQRITSLLLCLFLVFLPFASMSRVPGEPLTLGDGRVAKSPSTGHIFSCPVRGGGPTGGAHRSGPWIRDNQWHPNEKPKVEGRVSWSSRFTATLEGSSRVVRSNVLPNTLTGEFPVRRETRAYQFDRNPNSLREHNIVLWLPASPTMLASPECVPMGIIGIALNGAAIFSALDALGRDAPAYEVQDVCGGHPERSGMYHIHDWSPCLPDTGVIGWMIDGHPILGPRFPDGRWVRNGDLDECHGAISDYELEGQQRRGYAYRFTLEFPYTVGCFRAAPVRAQR